MKRIFLTILAILAFTRVFAQINPTVEVTRQYDVQLQDIHKPAVSTAVSDSLKKFDVTFDYSIFNRPYEDLYDFTPYEAVQISTVNALESPHFYAKIGAQYPLMPSGELYLQTGKNNLYGTLYGLHDSFLGDVPASSGTGQVGVERMNNSAGASLTYAWKTGELLVDGRFSDDFHSYSLSSIKDEHSRRAFDISANLSSADAADNSIYYDVNLGYRNSKFEMVSQQNSLGENFIALKGHIGSTFDTHRVYIDMNVKYASYTGARNFSSGIVEFSPIYKVDGNRLSAKLGVKFGNRYGISSSDSSEGDSFEPVTNFFPNVDARFALKKNSIWLHAIVGGGNQLNAFSEMYERMPVLVTSSDIRFGKNPLDARLSFESLTLGRLAVNLNGAFNIQKDRLFFAPQASVGALPFIRTAYMDVNELSFGGEIFWSSEAFEAGFSVQKSKYFASADEVTEFPSMTAAGRVRYNYRERISTSLEFAYKSPVSGSVYGAYEVPAVYDLDFEFNLMLSRHFTLFLKCGNVLDSRNQYMPQYIEPGRNFGGGLCIIF